MTTRKTVLTKRLPDKTSKPVRLKKMSRKSVLTKRLSDRTSKPVLTKRLPDKTSKAVLTKRLPDKTSADRLVGGQLKISLSSFLLIFALLLVCVDDDVYCGWSGRASGLVINAHELILVSWES